MEDDLIQGYVVSDDDDANECGQRITFTPSKHAHSMSQKECTTDRVSKQAKHKSVPVQLAGVRRQARKKTARHQHGKTSSMSV